jgi:prevent-host-death family protein
MNIGLFHGGATMAITTVSSREFQQNANRAQKAAENGPVVITNRGRPAHVLLSYDDYKAIAGKKRTIIEALSAPGLSGIEFELPQDRTIPAPADLS